MQNTEMVQTGKVVRVLDHGTNVQLLCADERGLLSVYLEEKNYGRFNKFIRRAGLTLQNLSVQFNREILRVSGPDNKWRACPVTGKTR